ncbi:hypothetical protein AA0X95_25640 [Bacillus sp. 1P10SD]|uniref:hypothetical protein n=1 Tax=Bacillus sp. 1P10SD TaxID=3132265 RepID=UPI0039A69E61
MKQNKLFLLAMMLIPWLSLPLLGKRAFKRFYPGALFIFVWVLFESYFAKKRLWWRFYEKLIPKTMGELPFMIGPFFVGSLWILKFTFGNFFRYLLLNLILDTLFAFPGMIALRRMGIVSLVSMKHYQMGLIFMIKSVIMYGFQSMIEKMRKKPKSLIQKIFAK